MAKNTSPSLELSEDQLFQTLVGGLQDYAEESAVENYDILDFIKYELELGIELQREQLLLPKLIYNLPLDDLDEAIIEYWSKVGRIYVDLSYQKKRQEICIEAGRRASKTLVSSIIAAFEFYKLCKLDNPQTHYGIATATEIAILTIATTATQGERTIYGTICGILKNCKFFKRLIQSGDLFIGTTKVTYDKKRLAVYSGNSKSGGQVGGTLKCFILEEAARFTDVDGNNNALLLWSNLGISTLTFGEDALRIAISSAWEENDAIWQLVEDTKHNPAALGTRLRSWDLNPIHAARENPVVSAEFNSTDPERVKRAYIEFEGIRPTVMDAFFDPEQVESCFKGEVRVHATPELIEEHSLQLSILNITHAEQAVYKSVAHIDSSVVKDAYAYASAHNEFDLSKPQALDKPIVVVDALLLWEPRAGSQVHMANVRGNISYLHSLRPLRKLTADHHAAAFETIQELNRKGVNAEAVYFSNSQQVAMYNLVRQLMKESRLILPIDSLWTPLLKRELKRLQLINGRKVDHKSGPNESKDLADAIAGVCWTLIKEAYLDRRTGLTPSFVKAQTQQQPDYISVPPQQSGNGFSGSRDYFRQQSPFSRGGYRNS